MGAEEAVRADRAWWERSASRPELVDRLTNVWLRDGGNGNGNTPTCTVTVRLVNSGTLATSGTIVVSLNGAEVARHPFSSAPGSNLAFPTTADNPVYSDPGARITALWLAHVEGGR